MTVTRHNYLDATPLKRRVTVTLPSLAEGAWIDEILADFPTLTESQERTVIAFAAASAEEELPVPALPVAA
ncbi:MAG: hypothetical protein KDE58_20940 [Caldilineaceae bacterium]|nr:hypothetical protein [Caldilineaceae bacterium]